MDMHDVAVSGEVAPPPTPMSPRHVLFRMWDGAFPASVCQAAIDEFTAEDFGDATIAYADGTSAVNPNTRRTRDVFVDPNHWIGALVSHFAHQANMLWGLDLAGLGTVTMLKYEESGHFTWHVDVLARGQMDYPGLGTGLERKVSVTVNLSDPADYDGGELQFIDGTGNVLTLPGQRERGSVIVFPSTVGHRVTPVTRGVRFALVGWLVGPPLR